MIDDAVALEVLVDDTTSADGIWPAAETLLTDTSTADGASVAAAITVVAVIVAFTV